MYAHGMNNNGLVYIRLINATVLQRHQKVFMTSQAKFYSEHYVIKYVGDRQYCFLYCDLISPLVLIFTPVLYLLLLLFVQCNTL